MFIEFGEPQSVLKSNIFDYKETYLIGGFYEPPISMMGLAKSLRANGMHSSAIYAKRNIISASVDLKGNLLTREDLNKIILEYIIFGNSYTPRVKNALGKTTKLQHVPALYMRQREKEDRYSYVTGSQILNYKTGSVLHLSEYDVMQEVYGIPQYFGALSSVWLNEEATLFRRKYYINGAHSGFLLYMNNPNLTTDQEKEIKAQLNSAKGLGNFKNMFVNGKGKDKEKPEIIPVGQITAKDEFSNIKNVSTSDILAAHRVPPDLMSIMREGFSQSGDLNKIDKIFYKNEVLPVIEILLSINDFAGVEVIKTKEYKPVDA